ncbi:MAG: Alpha N-terminal protein methyltransferase 1 [Icmadophila ericetorum]|nr:Alpha N-terminal protein methyltransferase 1 [Icmadophila ericetorum]
MPSTTTASSSLDHDPAPPDSQISHSSALTYWNDVSATVNGMLGGYPQISRIDLRGSANFLTKLRRQHPITKELGDISVGDGEVKLPRLKKGVDCGAGIGRVTTGFLGKVCEVVDVVEPVEKFAREVRRLDAGKMGGGSVGEVFVTGLENWEPALEAEREYDLIWNQWCLGHLTDVQLVGYLKRCVTSLKEGEGWIVVKENMSTDPNGRDIFDEEDSSVTRTDGKFRDMFREAGLRIERTELQMGFPKGLFPVRIYGLRPESWSTG